MYKIAFVMINAKPLLHALRHVMESQKKLKLKNLQMKQRKERKIQKKKEKERKLRNQFHPVRKERMLLLFQK